MTLYVDTSVLVALLLPDALNAPADRLLRLNKDVVVVSDFAAAEFASAVSRRVRMDDLAEDRARQHLASFDAWVPRSATRTEMRPDDVAAAAGYIRRLDLTLRTPDAIHVAIAYRLGATFATLDVRLATDAARLGVPVLSR